MGGSPFASGTNPGTPSPDDTASLCFSERSPQAREGDVKFHESETATFGSSQSTRPGISVGRTPAGSSDRGGRSITSLVLASGSGSLITSSVGPSGASPTSSVVASPAFSLVASPASLLVSG